MRPVSQLLRPARIPAAVAAAVLLASGCGGGSPDQHPGTTMSNGEMKSMGSPSARGTVLTLTGTEYSF